MTSHHKTVIAVVGSSAPSPQTLELAHELGRLAVERDCSIACGGMGGVMAAACAGAQQAKRARRERGDLGDLPQTVGILPGGDKQAANPDVDIVIPTGMGYTRNALVVLSGDVVVALEGGSGTLSEIAYAWQFGKPVAALAPSGGWAARLAGTSLDDKRDDEVFRAESAAEAIDHLLAVLGQPSR